MIKFRNVIFAFLLVSVLFTSCNGQTKAEQPNKAVVEEEPSFTNKNPKLTKTQGTTEHQNIHCSLQDKYGNLWFGTRNCELYRYNGSLFETFSK